MSDCNPVSMPMEQNIKLSKTMCPDTPEKKAEMAKVPYCKLVGKLLYLAVTMHPDISYAVGILCYSVENPSHEHWGAAKHLLQYLKGTVDLKLVYSCSTSLDCFVTYLDVDLGSNLDNSQSTGSFCDEYRIFPNPTNLL
jgi:hypothetical protein